MYKKIILTLIFLAFLYLILRTASITSIPFYTDEADYIFFSKAILQHPDQGFVSLIEGVKPFFMWSMLPFLYLSHGNDLLAAGRLSPLFMGLFCMFGIFFLTKELFKKTEIALLSTITYIFFPYAQIYNSIAVLEGTVATFMILSLLFLIKLIRKPSFENAFFFGILTGFGILTKRHAFFSLYLMPFTFFLFKFKKPFLQRLIQVVFFISFSLIIIYLLQLILHLSIYYERIAWFEGGPIYTKRAWLILPLGTKLEIFKNNFLTMLPFLISYITLPYLLLLIYSVTFFKKYWKEISLLFLYFFIPLCTLGFFGRRVGERYVYPMTLPLIPIISLSLYNLWQKIVKSLPKKYKRIPTIRFYFYSLFYLYPAVFILMIIFVPRSSPLPYSEKVNIFSCPMELFDKSIPYLNNISKDNKILLGTQNDLGFKNYLALKLQRNKNITVKGYFPENNVFPNAMRSDIKDNRAFYALLTTTYKSKISLPLIFERKSPYSRCIYRLYRVNKTN